MKRISQEEWISRARKVHKGFYSYDESVYKNMSTKVKIRCPVHGIFEQRAQDHIKGCGCKICSKSKISKSKLKKLDIIKKEIEKIYGDNIKIFGEYLGNDKKLKCVCKFHGEFEQYPKLLLKEYSCPKCSKYIFDFESFVNKATKIHNGRYNYDNVNYGKSKSKICIVCPKHGEFYQTPNSHLNGRGCPKCRMSKGC